LRLDCEQLAVRLPLSNYPCLSEFGGDLKIKQGRIFALAVLSLAITSCSAVAGDTAPNPETDSRVFTSIYWSDADSGRLGELKFRIANKDAPETGSLKQRGGAKCEAERALGYEAKAYMVGFTKGKEIRITRDYGEDRYGVRHERLYAGSAARALP